MSPHSYLFSISLLQFAVAYMKSHQVRLPWLIFSSLVFMACDLLLVAVQCPASSATLGTIRTSTLSTFLPLDESDVLSFLDILLDRGGNDDQGGGNDDKGDNDCGSGGGSNNGDGSNGRNDNRGRNNDDRGNSGNSGPTGGQANNGVGAGNVVAQNAGHVQHAAFDVNAGHDVYSCYS